MADIVIKKDGKWYYQRREIIHPEILNLFKNSLTHPEEGKYLLVIGNESAEVEVEDTPFFIIRVDREIKEDGKEEYLIFADNGKKEALEPETLSISKDNIIYCLINDGMFSARFERKAYYQLAEFIKEEEETGKFYLPQGGVKYYIAGKEDKE